MSHDFTKMTNLIYVPTLIRQMFRRTATIATAVLPLLDAAANVAFDCCAVFIRIVRQIVSTTIAGTNFVLYMINVCGWEVVYSNRFFF